VVAGDGQFRSLGALPFYRDAARTEVAETVERASGQEDLAVSANGGGLADTPWSGRRFLAPGEKVRAWRRALSLPAR
jgi:hypothetical protein